MTTDPAEDFDDPDVEEGSLRRHVVYRKRRDARELTNVAAADVRELPGHS